MVAVRLDQECARDIVSSWYMLAVIASLTLLLESPHVLIKASCSNVAS